MSIGPNVDYTVETDNGKTIIHYETIEETAEAINKLKKPYKIFIKYEISTKLFEVWSK